MIRHTADLSVTPPKAIQANLNGPRHQMYALKLSVQGMTLRRALSHCFFSSSLGACKVCEWPPSGSVLETLNTFFAGKKFENVHIRVPFTGEATRKAQTYANEFT